MTAFMKPGTASALKKIAALTLPKCEQCPSTLKLKGIKSTRCCDRMFCEIATVTMRELGGKPPEPTGHADLLYMGETGCIIPPEYRPICSGYVCPQQLDADPGFASRYRQLHERIAADPNVSRAVNRARSAIGGLGGAITRYREQHHIVRDEVMLEPGEHVWVTFGRSPNGVTRERGKVVSEKDGVVTVLMGDCEASDSFPRSRVNRVTSEDTDGGA